MNAEGDWRTDLVACRKRAEQGYSPAQRRYAKCLVERGDLTEGISWYKKVAEEGCPWAMAKLVDLYISESLPCRNEAAAIYWSRKHQPYTYRIPRKVVQKIECCQRTCMTLIAIKKYRPESIVLLPKDMVVMLAQYLWKTREEYIWFEGSMPSAGKLKYNI